MSLPKTVRGRRPRFYQTPGVDETMTMVLTLAQELVVLRERLEASERVMARHGIALKEEIETLETDDAQLREREAWRQEFLGRLFQFAQQARTEMAGQYSEDWYLKTLAEIARKD